MTGLAGNEATARDGDLWAEASAARLVRRFQAARARRSIWESHWQECYDFALPIRGAAHQVSRGGEKRSDKLFDATACDGVEQLAAALLAQLTPPWSRWFGLTPGALVEADDRPAVAATLEAAAERLKAHFDRSNFTVEIHQCFLDLVTVGTASLLVEEAAPGQASAFRFTCIPLLEAVFDEAGDGRLSITFRRSDVRLSDIQARFPQAVLPPEVVAAAARADDHDDADSARFSLLEAVEPVGGLYHYTAVLEAEPAVLLATGQFAESPFINFRWLRAPGEIYGRSPVMKLLPDIKTANKIVELVLKNASIAVTGIWQADDDGVLNPANVRLVPGAIIPKAVGSQGLQPLSAPGRFDLSQLMLDQLQARIRHGLMVDRLGPVAGPTMTATEVLERAGETNRLTVATFGRLHSELLVPLLARAIGILQRRGEIPVFALDGQVAELVHLSPLAKLQAQADVQNGLLWLEQVAKLGGAADDVIDRAAAARWLARELAVPADLLRPAAAAEAVTVAEASEVITDAV